MYDELCLRGVIVKRSDGKEERIKVSPENSVIIRPDKGRNIAATRISKYSGISSVSFNKARLSGSDVSIYDLTAEEQALVKDKIALMYDDEASTMGTINEIANALKKYGAKALAA